MDLELWTDAPLRLLKSEALRRRFAPRLREALCAAADDLVAGGADVDVGNYGAVRQISIRVNQGNAPRRGK